MLLPLWALAIASCGSTAAQRRDERMAPTRVATDDGQSEPTRSGDLAHDPAWESVPPDEDRRGSTSIVSSDAGPSTPACSGTCDAEGGACTDARGWQCVCDWQHDIVCGGAY
ncbi:MAG: hypothetical protein J0L92_39350, partial [Deltaproteobacteria bacterium]|nr:hypothetical protein [Deltaproteobacteria bacterium]